MSAPSAWQKTSIQISPMKRVGCLCGRKLARKPSGIQSRCHVFSLREGSAWTWEPVGGGGKWRPEIVSSGSAGQALKRSELWDCSLRVTEMSPSKYWWEGPKHMKWAVITRCASTEGTSALPSKFESTVCVLSNRVRGSRVKGVTKLRGADERALAAGFGLKPSICGTAEAGAGPSINHAWHPKSVTKTWWPCLRAIKIGVRHKYRLAKSWPGPAGHMCWHSMTYVLKSVLKIDLVKRSQKHQIRKISRSQLESSPDRSRSEGKSHDVMVESWSSSKTSTGKTRPLPRESLILSDSLAAFSLSILRVRGYEADPLTSTSAEIPPLPAAAKRPSPLSAKSAQAKTTSPWW